MQVTLKTVNKLYVQDANKEDLSKVEEFLEGAFGKYTKESDSETFKSPFVIYTFESDVHKFDVVDELMRMIEIHYNKKCITSIS